MKNRPVISAIVLVVVFLAGFVPQYAKVNHLDAELRQARLGNTSAELRDLVGLAYVQANQTRATMCYNLVYTHGLRVGREEESHQPPETRHFV